MDVYKLREIRDSNSVPLYWDLLPSKKLILKMGLLTLVFLYLYIPTFSALVSTWWTRDDYSHGFLIPLITLYLVWYRWEKLKNLQIQPAYSWGVTVMLIAGAMLLLGKAGGVITLQELSLVVMIVGLVLCLLGKNYLKALGFPIAYLLFMIPITDEVIAPYHWAFQLLTAKMGVAFLQTLGFTALLEHQYIILPAITLEVAKVCSGINYLISIIVIGIPLAYVTQKKVWCRVILVVSAVVIGVIANWIRVAAIGIWAYYGGEVLHGPFHLFQGLFVAQLGFIALFGGAWLLSKVPQAQLQGSHPDSVKSQPEEGGLGDQYGLLHPAWLAAFVILLGLAVYLSSFKPGLVPLKTGFALFPIVIDKWSGYVADADSFVFKVQGADHELLRIYQGPSGGEVQLYVAYFEAQHHTKELVNNMTAPLHHNATVVEIPFGRANTIRVNQTRLLDERGKWLAFFWYDFNGRIVADRYQAKFLTTMDALLHRRSNGAFVVVLRPLIGETNQEMSWLEEQAFIRNLIPVLHRYLP